MWRQLASCRRRDRINLGLDATGAEQITFIARRRPHVDGRCETASSSAKEVVLRANHDIAKAGRTPGCREHPLVGIVSVELMKRRVRGGRQAPDPRLNARIDI